MRRLPDSLSNLSSLTSLHVDGSWHVGQFPPRVAALQQMRRLELQNFDGVACLDLHSLPPNLPFATALRHLTLTYLNFEVSLDPLSHLVSLERLEVSSVDHEERFPAALFALPSLAHVKAGYVSWVEANHEVTTWEDVRELAALLGHVALNHDHPSATAPAAATAAAAAAAGAASDTANQSAFGPSLKHLIMCMGTPGNGRLGGTLSTRLCLLLSVTHLSIVCLTSSSHLPSSLGHLTNLRWLSLRGTWLCLPLSLSRLAPCLHSLKLHYSGSTTSEYLQRVLPSFLSNLTSLTNLHLRNMHVPFPRPPLRVCTPSTRFT
ncbi:unnamed protein product [Closterium sp. NIES-65]|nr:unnamed protein product [Closterium sp. NIES-65]